MNSRILLLAGLAGVALAGFSVDRAAFRATADSSRVEFFYAIPYSSLEYAERDSAFVAEFSVRFELDGPEGFREDATIFKQARVESFVEAQEAQRTFVDGFSLTLAPGDYRMKMTVGQPMPGAARGDTTEFVETASLSDSFRLTPYADRPALSSLQLAAGVVVDTATGELSVVPNPTRIYSPDGLDRVYFYVEGYNLSAESDSYEIHASIVGTEVPVETLVNAPPSVKETTGEAVGSVLGVSVAGLEPGEYLLDVALVERPSGAAAGRRARFAVGGDDESGGATRFRLELTGLEEKYYREIEYIATPRELAYYQSLGDSSRDVYLAWFWNRHNLAEYARRMETAQRYRTARTDGLRTDRGRVYVKYGEPDEIERLVLEVDRRPREYWHYFGSGYSFVFMDLRGDNNYRLAWTNSPDEPPTGLERYLTADEQEIFE